MYLRVCYSPGAPPKEKWIVPFLEALLNIGSTNLKMALYITSIFAEFFTGTPRDNCIDFTCQWLIKCLASRGIDTFVVGTRSYNSCCTNSPRRGNQMGSWDIVQILGVR